MKTERAKNATKNLLFGLLLKIYQLLMPFLMRTAMIQLIGIEYLGLNSLFASILQVLNLTELGVGSAMVFSLYHPVAEEDERTICALMRLYKLYYRAIGFIVAIIGLAIVPFIPKLINGEVPGDINIYTLYLLNLAATVLSYWLFAYKNSLLEAHQRVDITSKVTIYTDTFKYITQLLVLWIFKNYYLFVIVLLLSQALTNIITSVIATKIYPSFQPKGKLSKEEVKTINERIRDLFTSKFGGVVVNSADTIVISAFLGLTTLAIYQNYFYIITSLMGILSTILGASRAGIGNSIATENKEKNLNDFKKLSMIIWICLNFCISCLVCILQPFMRVWVGEELMLPTNMTFFFAVYFFMRTTMTLFSIYKDAAGIWRSDRFRPLLEALLNLALNLISIGHFGLYGILFSTIISMAGFSLPWLLNNLFKNIFLQGEKEYLVLMFKNVILITLTSSFLYVICNFITIGGLWEIAVKFIISSTFSSLIYIGVMRKNIYFQQLKAMLSVLTNGKVDKFLSKI